MAQGFTQENVSSRVEKIIGKQIGSDTALSPETQLQDDLNLDSLELVELSITLEKEFGVPLADAQVRHCVTLSDVIQLVLRAEPEEEASSV